MSHLDFAQHSVWLQNLVDRRQMELIAHLVNSTKKKAIIKCFAYLKKVKVKESSYILMIRSLDLQMDDIGCFAAFAL